MVVDFRRSRSKLNTISIGGEGTGTWTTDWTGGATLRLSTRRNRADCTSCGLNRLIARLHLFINVGLCSLITYVICLISYSSLVFLSLILYVGSSRFNHLILIHLMATGRFWFSPRSFQEMNHLQVFGDILVEQFSQGV